MWIVICFMAGLGKIHYHADRVRHEGNILILERAMPTGWYRVEGLLPADSCHASYKDIK